MKELQQAISRLRLLLAEIKSREEQLNSQCQQFTTQLGRATRYALYGNLSLDSFLSLMGEIQERLNQARMQQEHLAILKQKAQEELEALELTQTVEKAKGELQSLKARREQQDKEEVAEEIQRLEAFIAESSKKAARSITAQHPPA